MAFRRLWLLFQAAVTTVANRISQADVSWLGFSAFAETCAKLRTLDHKFVVKVDVGNTVLSQLR